MQMNFKQLWWMFLLIAIVSYLIGNVNFARIISRSKNRDITKEGSGNPGTMNMSRTFGLKIGLLTFTLDVLKSAIPTFVAKLIFKEVHFAGSVLNVSVMAQYVAGLFAIIGHIFPVIYRFKSGKGIACTIGVFLVTQPLVGVISALLAFGFILVTAMGSMGSMIAITPPAIAELISLYKLSFEQEPIFEYGMTFFIITEITVFLIMLLVWYASRGNLTKLISGDEHATAWLDMLMEKRIKRKHARLVKKGLLPPEDKDNQA